MKRIAILVLTLALFACTSPMAPRQPSASSTPPAVPKPTSTPGMPLPPVEGPEPSSKVAAFYYPWYGNSTVDGEWIHWTQSGHQPPKDIASDYMPALGAYSSNDPAVVAQHMAWLRQAGVGVIIVSWWGQGCREEKPIPLIMKMAERYGIKVTFHIEPYAGRTADSLLSDLKYLYGRYGSDPAFFLSTATSRYSPSSQPKPMFFVWDIGEQEMNKHPVQADYWQKTIDAIHALPQGGLVIANTEQGSWITGGHFDGLYNYATLHLDQEGGFAWARSLPPDALYIPSVIPGFSAQRVGYPADTLVPRQDGATFSDQWAAALGTGVQPEMVTVTSFNEWHEGSMIEPPAVGADNGPGYKYEDFGKLRPDGYLTMTCQWVDKFLATTWPAVARARIQITTTSDWTTLNVVSGGAWIRPELISAAPGLVHADMEAGDRFVLMQSLADAESGKRVQMTCDVEFSGLDPAGTLILEIDRGNLGASQVTIFNYLGDTPVSVKTFRWGGVTSGRNPLKVEIPASELLPSTEISSPAPTELPTATGVPTPIANPNPNQYIVISQLNLWYHGPGCYGGFEQFNCSGKRSTALTPLLGATYDSANPSVIQQQINWAAAYGVDAFSIEWTTPRGVGDSLENTLDDDFLKAPNLNKIRWCIFYDLVLRITQTPGLNVI